MVVYTGEYEHSIDDKARVILPSKMRNKIGDHCFLTRGYDKCINVYAEDDFHALMQKLADESRVAADATLVQRRFVSSEVTVDGQGRLPISKPLMDYAGIDADQKAVILIGTVGRIEIWAKDNWETYSANLTDEMVTTAVRSRAAVAE